MKPPLVATEEFTAPPARPRWLILLAALALMALTARLGWWQLDLQPEATEPSEPQPFSLIRGNESIGALLRDACIRFQGG